VIQISDTHIYPEPGWELYGVSTESTLRQVIDAVQKRHDRIDAIVLTGDLVHDAPIAGYERLKHFFDCFDAPVYCLPGNHDDLSLMESQFNDGRFFAAGEAGLKNWRLFFLDSTRPGCVEGYLEKAQLSALDQALHGNTDQPVLVFLHHQPVMINSHWLDRIGLQEPGDFLDIVSRHRHVKAVSWGHIHQEWDETAKHVRLLATPSSCVQFKPGASTFETDSLAPGWRWFTLHDDGHLETGVERI
jgi:Icc protein